MGIPMVGGRATPVGYAVVARVKAVADQLGIQEAIYDRLRWSARFPEGTYYGGVSPHYDHVHLSQNKASAQSLTYDAAMRLLSGRGGEGEQTPIEGDEMSATEVQQILSAIRNKPTPELWYGPEIMPGRTVNLPVLAEGNIVIKQGVIFLHLSWGNNQPPEDTLEVHGKQLRGPRDEAIGLFGGGVFGRSYGIDTIRLQPRLRYGFELSELVQSVVLENRGDHAFVPLFTSGTSVAA